MPFDNYQNMLNNMLSGNYQGVGANTGGGVTTGANQYYYNPSPNTLSLANYMPNPAYNPTASHMLPYQTPAYQSQFQAAQSMPNPFYRPLFPGLAPTTGMAPYTPPAAGLGPMAGAVDFTTPNLGGGGGGGAPQTPAGMTRGVPGGTTAPAGLGTGGSVGGGGSYGGERPAPGSTPVSQQRYTPGTNATYGMNRGAMGNPYDGAGGGMLSNYYAPQNNFAQLISQLSQAGIPPAVMMALAMRLQRGM